MDMAQRFLPAANEKFLFLDEQQKKSKMSRLLDSSSRWAPSLSKESKRLKIDMNRSMLCSSRTRGKRIDFANITNLSYNSNNTGNANTDDMNVPPTDPPEPPEPPRDEEEDNPGENMTHTRVILETQPLKEQIERFMYCPKCRWPVKATFPTTCIASHCRIECTNYNACHWFDKTPIAGTDIDLGENAGSPLIERNSDYAINVLYVLGFMCSGDGGKEAERLLGLLGLPNATTMEKRSFGTITEQISPTILQLADDILYENLEVAVKEWYEKEHADNEESERLFELWKLAVASPDVDLLPRPDYPKLNFSADMGWQRRSSGNQCNSNSGHAVLVEQKTRHPVIRSIKSKLCAKCKGAERSGKPVKPHFCTINHDGSASSMEPQAVLDMVVRLFQQYKVETLHVVADDDSAMKAKLKYSNDDYMAIHNLGAVPTALTKNGNEVERPDKGRLPTTMPEPTFLNDPNHRKKTLKGELCKQLRKKKATREGLTRCDILRTSTNFVYVIRTLHLKQTDEEMTTAAKAVVEHHFDNHEFCGTWCRSKELSDEDKATCRKVHRDKEKDEALYNYLTNLLARFISLSALKEVAHPFDTQVNESLNDTFAWCAPKNKTHCGSVSLSVRIATAVSIHTIGFERFFIRLFGKLGINCTQNIVKFLRQQQSIRVCRITKSRKHEVKLKRNTKLHERLKKFTEEARKEIAKRDGVAYEPAMGLGGGYTEEELNASATAKKRKAPIVCQRCNKAGHRTYRSSKCDHHDEYLEKQRRKKDKAQQPQQDDDAETQDQEDIAAQQAEIDGDEADLMDQIPLDYSDNEFFDAIESETESMAASSTG